MQARPARDALLVAIDERFFDPILAAEPGRYRDVRERRRLRALQAAVRTIRHRYVETCPTADDVLAAFEADLDGFATHDIEDQLRELRLPTMAEAAPAVRDAARELGVSESDRAERERPRA
jgi:hypothetical protein